MHCETEDCEPVAVLQLLSKGTSMGVEGPVQSVPSKTSAVAAEELRQVTVRDRWPWREHPTSCETVWNTCPLHLALER